MLAADNLGHGPAEDFPAMFKNAAALWRAYTTWVRRLPQATVFIFAARSRWGRSFKIFLFGVGMFPAPRLPDLGAALLAWQRGSQARLWPGA
jgi:hypothetical protein